MRILVGTENKRKIEAVRTVIDDVFVGDNEYAITGFSAVSDVSETPLGEETKQGAINRAVSAEKHNTDYDLYIGIESGLINRFGDWYEEVWSAIIYDGKIYTAYSSGVKLPESISTKLLPDVSNHRDIMNSFRVKYNMGIDAALGVDTWGDYTGNKISREIGLEEAVRNALVQIFPGKGSLYSRAN